MRSSASMSDAISSEGVQDVAGKPAVGTVGNTTSNNYRRKIPVMNEMKWGIVRRLAGPRLRDTCHRPSVTFRPPSVGPEGAFSHDVEARYLHVAHKRQQRSIPPYDGT